MPIREKLLGNRGQRVSTTNTCDAFPASPSLACDTWLLRTFGRLVELLSGEDPGDALKLVDKPRWRTRACAQG